jgi:hypothetical protein
MTAGNTRAWSALICAAALASAAALAVSCKRTSSRATAGRAEDAGVAARPVVHAAPDRQRIVITDIVVRVVDPPVVRELYSRQLARALGRALVGSDLFAASAPHVPEGYEPRPASLDVLIHYDVLEAGSTGEPAAVVSIESSFVWEEAAAQDPAPRDRLMVEQPVPGGLDPSEHDGLVAALASEAIEHLALRLAERERVRAGSDAALAAVLTDAAADPSAVLWALDLVAHRRARALFDQVADKLDAEAAQVRQRAVTALAALDHPGALAAITEHMRFDDIESMGVVIDTVAALGGEDARAYLELVASGHPDDEIRARARIALGRLAR